MNKYIFLLVLIPALAGVTLYTLRNIDNTKRSATAGNKFYKVLFSQKDSKLLEEIGSNWEYLANFERASNHILNSMPKDAASIYSDMVDNEAVPNVLRELAQYLVTKRNQRTFKRGKNIKGQTGNKICVG